MGMDEDNDDGLGGRSRTRREVSERWRWGEQLVKLELDVLAYFPGSDVLKEAVLDGARTDSPIARRRQVAFIDRLIREGTDEERDAIVAFLANPAKGLRAAQRAFDADVERILADDAALTQWFTDHPGADAQRVRTLVRNARKDRAKLPALREALRT
jgi:ribosome-associated protein